MSNATGLSDTDQKDIQSFLETKQAEARVQSSIHNFTDLCWDKCVTSSISTRFGRGEEACLSNCVEREVLDSELAESFYFLPVISFTPFDCRAMYAWVWSKRTFVIYKFCSLSSLTVHWYAWHCIIPSTTMATFLDTSLFIVNKLEQQRGHQ